MSSSEADTASTSQQEASHIICRDFLRNVCRRGKRCRYYHEESISDKASKNEADSPYAPVAQDTIEFCRDYLVGKGCRRSTCRYLHGTASEENDFIRRGYLSPKLMDQAALKGIAPDLPVLYGDRPLCKDHIKGSCSRNHCKYRHVTPREYEYELTRSQSSNEIDRHPSSMIRDFGRSWTDFSGNEYFSAPKRIRHEFSSQDRVTTLENTILRSHIIDLNRQLSDMATTNNFLLQQNAELRLGIKASNVATSPTDVEPLVSATLRPAMTPAPGTITISRAGQPQPEVSASVAAASITVPAIVQETHLVTYPITSIRPAM